jgi:hypothetical protein
MALVDRLEPQTLERDAAHRPVRCTYSIVTGSDGHRLLQLDTYGSEERQIRDKKSQSIRFSEQALSQLISVIRENGLLTE